MAKRRLRYFETETRARIEVIPMIDIMMFLLVFFILATLKMIQSSGIALDLPKSATASELESARVTIQVDRTGRTLLDAQPVAREALIEHLRGLLSSKRVDVVIAGDKAATYEHIIRVMDTVREAGVTAVALATSPP